MLLKPHAANYTTLQLRTTTKIMATFSIVKQSNLTPNTLLVFTPSLQSDYANWGISWISSVPPHKSWIIISNYTIPSFHILTNSLFTSFYPMTQKSQLLKALLKTNKCCTTTSWQNIPVQICKQLQWNTRGVNNAKACNDWASTYRLAHPIINTWCAKKNSANGRLRQEPSLVSSSSWCP